MANPYIKLCRRMTTDAEGQCRMRAWVAETTNQIPPEIFMYQWLPVVPLQDIALRSMFVAVCTYDDLNRLPTTFSGDVRRVFFRKNKLDLTFVTYPVAEKYWIWISGMVKQTVEDFSRLNALPPAEVLEISL